jgi:hypothetical protein
MTNRHSTRRIKFAIVAIAAVAGLGAGAAPVLASVHTASATHAVTTGFTHADSTPAPAPSPSASPDDNTPWT